MEVVTQTFVTFIEILNNQKDLPNLNVTTPAQQNTPKPNNEEQK
jgi:hypothetical protein